MHHIALFTGDIMENLEDLFEEIIRAVKRDPEHAIELIDRLLVLPGVETHQRVIIQQQTNLRDSRLTDRQRSEVAKRLKRIQRDLFPESGIPPSNLEELGDEDLEPLGPTPVPPGRVSILEAPTRPGTFQRNDSHREESMEAFVTVDNTDEAEQQARDSVELVATRVALAKARAENERLEKRNERLTREKQALSDELQAARQREEEMEKMIAANMPRVGIELVTAQVPADSATWQEEAEDLPGNEPDEPLAFGDDESDTDDLLTDEVYFENADEFGVEPIDQPSTWNRTRFTIVTLVTMIVVLFGAYALRSLPLLKSSQRAELEQMAAADSGAPSSAEESSVDSPPPEALVESSLTTQQLASLEVKAADFSVTPVAQDLFGESETSSSEPLPIPVPDPTQVPTPQPLEPVPSPTPVQNTKPAKKKVPTETVLCTGPGVRIDSSLLQLSWRKDGKTHMYGVRGRFKADPKTGTCLNADGSPLDASCLTKRRADCPTLLYRIN